jgi:CPA1 family monovalent cation:H+ antiporter
MFEAIVLCLVATALMSYVNARFVGLPPTIGVMAIALLISLSLVVLDAFDVTDLHRSEVEFVRSIDFSKVLMEGMLSMLLFAGALHVDFSLLRRQGWQVAILAIFGTALCTLLVGATLWWILPQVGLSLSPAYCLVFGALISPTDPIAVVGMLKAARAPDDVGILVSGESLFNDGVGVVLFSVLLAIAVQGTMPAFPDVAMRLLQEAGGGIVLGAASGALAFALLRSIDNYQVEVILTIAAVLGGYQLARWLHTSGPLAMVVMGLIIGNHGRANAMSDTTRHHVDLFWELLDGMLNAALFVLIGLEIVVVPFSYPTMIASVCAILVVLAARVAATALPILILRPVLRFPPGAGTILVWGGLRGGISVALALSLPDGPSRDLALGMTYVVVLFSILVQGLTFKRAAARIMSRGSNPPMR